MFEVVKNCQMQALEKVSGQTAATVVRCYKHGELVAVRYDCSIPEIKANKCPVILGVTTANCAVQSSRVAEGVQSRMEQLLREHAGVLPSPP